MTVNELKEKFELEVLAGDVSQGRKISGCYISDLLSLAMSRVNENDVWVTVQTNINIVAVAVLTEAACIVVAEGIKVDEETINKADSQGVIILGTGLTAFEFACHIEDYIL